MSDITFLLVMFGVCVIAFVAVSVVSLGYMVQAHKANIASAEKYHNVVLELAKYIKCDTLEEKVRAEHVEKLNTLEHVALKEVWEKKVSPDASATVSSDGIPDYIETPDGRRLERVDFGDF